MKRYKVGDKVIIRPDLKYRDGFGNIYVVDDMERMRGKKAIITAVIVENYHGNIFNSYHLDIDFYDYFWTADMFLDKPFDKHFVDLAII